MDEIGEVIGAVVITIKLGNIALARSLRYLGIICMREKALDTLTPVISHGVSRNLGLE